VRKSPLVHMIGTLVLRQLIYSYLRGIYGPNVCFYTLSGLQVDLGQRPPHDRYDTPDAQSWHTTRLPIVQRMLTATWTACKPRYALTSYMHMYTQFHRYTKPLWVLECVPQHYEYSQKGKKKNTTTKYVLGKLGTGMVQLC
jgi:hypothetical protein